MAKRILTMRKIKEILRLRWALELSERMIGASLKIAHSTVGEYLKRAERAGLDWAQVENMAESELKARLFPPKPSGSTKRSEPDWHQPVPPQLDPGACADVRVLRWGSQDPSSRQSQSRRHQTELL